MYLAALRIAFLNSNLGLPQSLNVPLTTYFPGIKSVVEPFKKVTPQE